MKLNVKQALARLPSQLFDYVHKQSRILDNSNHYVAVAVSVSSEQELCVLPELRLLANLSSCSFAACRILHFAKQQLRAPTIANYLQPEEFAVARVWVRSKLKSSIEKY